MPREKKRIGKGGPLRSRPIPVAAAAAAAASAPKSRCGGSGSAGESARPWIGGGGGGGWSRLKETDDRRRAMARRGEIERSVGRCLRVWVSSSLPPPLLL